MSKRNKRNKPCRQFRKQPPTQPSLADGSTGVPNKVFDIIHPDKGRETQIEKGSEEEAQQRELNELSGEILESKLEDSHVVAH